MRTVDYDHILGIIEKCAIENKSAREVYNLIVFSFGK
jgi:hypothetical protein